MIIYTSHQIGGIPFLDNLLGSDLKKYRPFTKCENTIAVAGWGFKKPALKARRLAARLQIPYLALEDGFLRSYHPGRQYPPLSIVLDRAGIYYNSYYPSDLENILNSKFSPLRGVEAIANDSVDLIVKHRLSKYNSFPIFSVNSLRSDDKGRVLVVDQTAGDMSVSLGGASTNTFYAMLQAALAENPLATIYVKTHPEVSSGRKTGYLTEVQDDTRIAVLRDPINPLSLIEEMDRVYVVTSTMGFEALLMGKPVTCFGIPWYSGWGVTEDRQGCPRRMRRRTVGELFAAAYLHYARYLNPVTHQCGTIFDVITWLIRQRRTAIPQTV
jgi:capsular polysaccharide export protein